MAGGTTKGKGAGATDAGAAGVTTGAGEAGLAASIGCADFWGVDEPGLAGRDG